MIRTSAVFLAAALVAAQPSLAAISPQAAERQLTVGGGKPITLGLLVTDYVDHLLHHLRHIGIHFGEN